MSDSTETAKNVVEPQEPETVEQDDKIQVVREGAEDQAPIRPKVMVDPRGQRFNAAMSVLVLATVLLVGIQSNLAVVLLTLQGVAFGLGGMLGLRYQPYGWLYRSLIRPRIGKPKSFEAEPPPRFAQLVGFIFVLIAMAGLAFSVVPLAYIAVGLALAAAFLNAAFGFCLGCQMYLTYKRMVS